MRLFPQLKWNGTARAIPLIESAYHDALNKLMICGLEDIKVAEDSTTVRAILGVIALAKGSVTLGALISTLDESEIEEYLKDHLGWTEYYD